MVDLRRRLVATRLRAAHRATAVLHMVPTLPEVLPPPPARPGRRGASPDGAHALYVAEVGPSTARLATRDSRGTLATGVPSCACRTTRPVTTAVILPALERVSSSRYPHLPQLPPCDVRHRPWPCGCRPDAAC